MLDPHFRRLGLGKAVDLKLFKVVKAPLSDTQSSPKCPSLKGFQLHLVLNASQAEMVFRSPLVPGNSGTAHRDKEAMLMTKELQQAPAFPSVLLAWIAINSRLWFLALPGGLRKRGKCMVINTGDRNSLAERERERDNAHLSERSDQFL